jgi:hypothetical protein
MSAAVILPLKCDFPIVLTATPETKIHPSSSKRIGGKGDYLSAGCGMPRILPYPPVVPVPSLLGQLAADRSPAGRQPSCAAGHY